MVDLASILKMSAPDLLKVAIKTEIEAEQTYASFAKKVTNTAIKDRLQFLALEENKHKSLLEQVYIQNFGANLDEQALDSVENPLEVGLSGPDAEDIVKLYQASMEAEKTATEFYSGLAGKFEDDMTRRLLAYLSRMEDSHYQMLRTDYEMYLTSPELFSSDTWTQFQ